MERPSATLVVPFAGSPGELEAVARRFGEVRRAETDELVIVDNSPQPAGEPAVDGVRIVRDAAVHAPGYARNAGAASARGEWLVFCDADTEPDPALLERLLDPLPPPEVAILAGGVVDDPQGDSIAARLARETEAMSQRQTLSNPYLPFAITANCAIRRAVFEALGGFDPEIYLGEDADLCWRVQQAGHRLDERPGAVVRHYSRTTLPALWRQRMRHGAGCDWLRVRYPGAMPRWGLAALVRDSALRLLAGVRARLRGERGRLSLEAATVSGWWAFELGRRTSNASQPGRVSGWIRR